MLYENARIFFPEDFESSASSGIKVELYLWAKYGPKSTEDCWNYGIKIENPKDPKLSKKFVIPWDNRSAEGRTRTGTLDNQRRILSPLRLRKSK